MLVSIADTLDAFVARRRAAPPRQRLGAVMSELLSVVEEALGGSLRTSILLLDPAAQVLTHLAAPNLPQSYCAAIDGLAIGPSVGSCGTAAYLGHAVYVTDIQSDPLWRDFAALAGEHGLAACWSTPIHGTEGDVLGTFAIYYLERRSPTPEEIKAIALITQVARREIELSRKP